MIAENDPENMWINLAGFEVLVLAETGSTNDDATIFSEQVDGEFAVWAKLQNAGRGRENRHWQAAQGCSLTFSLVLRPGENEIAFINQFTAMGALALADLLSSTYGLPAEIKWPNDVLIHGKKVSGILTEIIWSGSSLESIILGIGVNFKSEAFIQAGELRFPATSLEAEGVEIDSLQDFLKQLLFFLRQRRQQLGSAQFLEDWNQKLAFRNQFMPITQYQGKTEMLCPGSINADGSLNARNQAGELRVVYSSEISDPSAGSSSLSTSSSEESSSS